MLTESRGLMVVRVMSGSFMTSLEMAGMSLTLMVADEHILELFGKITQTQDADTQEEVGKKYKQRLFTINGALSCYFLQMLRPAPQLGQI